MVGFSLFAGIISLSPWLTQDWSRQERRRRRKAGNSYSNVLLQQDGNGAPWHWRSWKLIFLLGDLMHYSETVPITVGLPTGACHSCTLLWLFLVLSLAPGNLEVQSLLGSYPFKGLSCKRPKKILRNSWAFILPIGNKHPLPTHIRKYREPHNTFSPHSQKTQEPASSLWAFLSD